MELFVSFAIICGVILLIGWGFSGIADRYRKLPDVDWLKDIYP
jgi:hypothetical protein